MLTDRVGGTGLPKGSGDVAPKHRRQPPRSHADVRDKRSEALGWTTLPS